jgi:predicted O-linked N-acetylglucosamine transferase (SPINDLY family)
LSSAIATLERELSTIRERLALSEAARVAHRDYATALKRIVDDQAQIIADLQGDTRLERLARAVLARKGPER